ncbi:helix-turn-helix domain-containing protein [Amycolatopsis nalaikhensis]|uniref:Helix-turn-helix transcriptional regulator n=1 Tax=Amycolatopsis nalaikhensis TaxID=715472 RepID=A0ABY8XYV4_9PSEU|nr:helix-turn-helix transcriptional regulator [Amycolatopsis sp. 2-2]WIV60596.1 helix-turn-helix transcriptional regulator [Amycolatopsis sp. 2-2]
MAKTFGARFREFRAAAGFSMGELAKRVNYSKSYISKIENDVKPPSALLARICDRVLDAGGALIEAARETREPPSNKLDRGQMLAGAGAVLGIALAGGSRPILDDRAVAGLRASFEQLRALGMQTSPAVVLESLVTQTHTVHALARGNPEPVRSRLLLLAARMAEYTGWLSQEAGNDHDALSWTRHAAELGRAGGDREIESYAFVREAGLALYRQDPIATIDLARQAQKLGRAGSRTFGLAARREAQGHALAGDRDAFERALDRAAGPLYASTVDTKDYPVLGSTAPDPLALARGWSLADLGLAGESATLLGGELARVPVTNRRTRARFGVRRSLAHALDGEIDESCRTLAAALDDVAHVDSATVRTDLRELARCLSRWRGHHTVREIYPELSRVLHRH